MVLKIIPTVQDLCAYACATGESTRPPAQDGAELRQTSTCARQVRPIYGDVGFAKFNSLARAVALLSGACNRASCSCSWATKEPWRIERCIEATQASSPAVAAIPADHRQPSRPW